MIENQRIYRTFFLIELLTFIFLLNFVSFLNGSSNETFIYSNFIPKSEIIENEYIVTFLKYMNHEEHQILLESILGKTGWKIIERKNPAWKLPSDFSLIQFIEQNQLFLARSLNSLKNDLKIKYITPHRKFFGSLKEENDPEADFLKVIEDSTINNTGRMKTKFSKEESNIPRTRRLHSLHQIPELFNAHFLWEKGFTGTGIKVAIFDTGLRANHPHFKNIVEITNWTDEKTTEDGLGHGTFVAGVIASQAECLGFVPDADIHIFKVFTNNRVSYTSWFLDAFNYAIHSKVTVLNLSIGGPDFMDKPFVEKVWELSANNIIVVSAIGNDGPLYGTLNNPADQMDVIGVGGIDFGEKLASFSSRGMTTWELPNGYGRVKPDILAYGQSVQGSRIYGGCRALSGTSVASPVVAGAVTLLISSIPENKRPDIINPASIKQVLVNGAERLPDSNIFEQGYGKLNLIDSYELLRRYTPHASCLPSSLDLTQCPYMWPYCSQPLYFGALPIILNVTIMNGMGVSGEIEGTPVWKPGKNGELLEISFTHSELLWPWSGYLAVHIIVHQDAENFQGEAEGIVSFTVSSPPKAGESEFRKTLIDLPVKVKIIPTPPRSKRILWDQYHNLRYPSGYFPRDALEIKDEPFDWNGDHIHTNFRQLFNFLRGRDYFIEVLGTPYTCFDAKQYGTLLVVDPEEEFFPVEIKKLKHDIEKLALNLIVIGDWYNTEVMKKINFFDDNTKQWWTPATGGSNIPALNDLLKEFSMAFGDRIYSGEFSMTRESSMFASGTSIINFPVGGALRSFFLTDETEEILRDKQEKKLVPVLGLFPVASNESQSIPHQGRIALFGDSSCLDDSYTKVPCFWLIESLLKFVTQNKIEAPLDSLEILSSELQTSTSLPKRMDGNDLIKYSKVIGKSATCTKMDFRRYNKTEGETIEIFWEVPQSISPSSGKFRQDTLSKNNHNLHFNTWQYSLSGSTLIYLIVFVVVILILIMAFRARSASIQNRRFQV